MTRFIALATVLLSFAAFANDKDDFITAAAGKIAVTNEDPPADSTALGRILKPAAKKTGPYSIEGEKSWAFNVVAVLKREAKGASVHLVFYDKDDKDALKKFAPVRAIEVNPAAHNKVVTVPNIQVSEDQGFVGGKTYIVRVTELEGGTKEVVLAESQLTLAKTKPAKAEEPAKDE